MLSIERHRDSLVLISDDAEGENAAVADAMVAVAPHMAADYNETKVSDDGRLRFTVQSQDWSSLIEALEELSRSFVVDAEELQAALLKVEDALESLGAD